MENWIIPFMEEYGYLGIFLMIMLENVFPPIPSEIVLAFGGVMTTQTNMTIVGVITASTAGAVAGAIILYYIGRLLSFERLEKIVERWGHILRTTKEDVHKANQQFEKYGVWTVFFCRMIPIVRSLISIPAGMGKMGMLVFIIFTTLGSLIWNSILVNLGAMLGNEWETILDYMGVYQNVVLVIFAIVAVICAVIFIKKRFYKTEH